jgi:hypothetical protein
MDFGECTLSSMEANGDDLEMRYQRMNYAELRERLATTYSLEYSRHHVF